VPRRVLAKVSERNYPSFWHEEHLLMASGERFGRVREWPR